MAGESELQFSGVTVVSPAGSIPLSGTETSRLQSIRSQEKEKKFC